MQWNAKVLCAVVATVLVACDGWPPYSERYKSRFLDNQSEFEELSAKLLATDYRRVSLFVEGKTPMVVFREDEYDEGRATNGTDIIREVDASWTDLLVQTDVFDIERNSQAITFWALPTFDEHLVLGVLKKDRVMSIRYTHVLEGSDEQWTCKSGHEELACGRCSIPLVDDWSVQYSWAPDKLAPDALQQHKKGEVSQEEYQDLWLASWNSCQLAGAKAIGYEVTEAKEFPR
jgi:hypothetical protein